MLVFSRIGVWRQVNHVFTRKLFIGEATSGELFIFVGAIIFVFEFSGFDLYLEEFKLLFVGAQTFGQFPVSGHGLDGLISPGKTEDNSEDQNNVFNRKKPMF